MGSLDWERVLRRGSGAKAKSGLWAFDVGEGSWKETCGFQGLCSLPSQRLKRNGKAVKEETHIWIAGMGQGKMEVVPLPQPPAASKQSMGRSYSKRAMYWHCRAGRAPAL